MHILLTSNDISDMIPSVYVSLIVLGQMMTAVIANDPIYQMTEALKDENSMMFYAQCFLDKGPCTKDGQFVKKLLPNLVSTSCARCSPRQKELACKIIYTFKRPKYAHVWNEFLAKYDPYHQYRRNLGQFLQSC